MYRLQAHIDRLEQLQEEVEKAEEAARERAAARDVARVAAQKEAEEQAKWQQAERAVAAGRGRGGEAAADFEYEDTPSDVESDQALIVDMLDRGFSEAPIGRLL